MTKSRTNRPKNDRTERRKRPPVNGKGSVLEVIDQDPNYKYHVFNDKGNRIEQYKQYGWEPVGSDDASINSSNVVKAGTVNSVVVDSQEGTEGILMRIPKEWHEEDKQAQQDAVDAKEAQIFRQSETQGNYGKVSKE